MLEDRRRIGRDEVFPLADSDEDGRALARDDDFSWLVARDHRDAVRADDVLQRGNDARLERIARGVLDQVRERLGVGVATERVAGVHERGAQRFRVLDDAVVYDRNATLAVGVWMRVAFGGRAMRGPARVRDAARALDRQAVHQLAQRRHPPGQLARDQAMAVPHREPGGVVAAVLEPRERLKQNRRRLAVSLTCIADDSAHYPAFFRIRPQPDIPKRASCESFVWTRRARLTLPNRLPQCEHSRSPRFNWCSHFERPMAG